MAQINLKDFYPSEKKDKVMRLGKRCLRIHKDSFDNWLNRQVSAS